MWFLHLKQVHQHSATARASPTEKRVVLLAAAFCQREFVEAIIDCLGCHQPANVGPKQLQTTMPLPAFVFLYGTILQSKVHICGNDTISGVEFLEDPVHQDCEFARNMNQNDAFFQQYIESDFPQWHEPLVSCLRLQTLHNWKSTCISWILNCRKSSTGLDHPFSGTWITIMSHEELGSRCRRSTPCSRLYLNITISTCEYFKSLGENSTKKTDDTEGTFAARSTFL